jgi:hypothetical protein
MPVLSMHEASWQDPREMLSNAQEMPSVRQNMVPVPAVVRAQDDARVGYLFQRPPPQGQQTEMIQQPPPGPQFVNKPWLGGERGLEQVRLFSLFQVTFSINRTPLPLSARC